MKKCRKKKISYKKALQTVALFADESKQPVVDRCVKLQFISDLFGIDLDTVKSDYEAKKKEVADFFT